MFSRMVKYRSGALCLIGILSATFIHTATYMSRYFDNDITTGAIAAFVLDAVIVAIAIFKDELLKDGGSVWKARLIISIALFVMGIANMALGFQSAYGVRLSLDSLANLGPFIWIQWVAGTIVFPVAAYIMCDMIGTRNLLQLRLHNRFTKPRMAR